MRYENDGNGFRETRARIHVQTDAGLALAGQLLFNYNSENEILELRSVRVFKPDRSSIATGPESIQDLTAPVAQIAPVYSDARQKHVTVSGLSVGDVLEYDVVINSKPLDPGQFWQTYQFFSGAICLDEELELNVPKDRALKMRSPDGFSPEVREEHDRRIYRWKASNLIVPKPVEVLKTFQIDVRRMLQGPRLVPPPRVEFSTFQSWTEVGNWYASLERDRREPTPAIRSQVDEILRGKTNDIEKAQALYEWVMRNIRYVSLSFGVGRYQPHAATDVLRNRYGDCKDKTTLLQAFFAAAGIQANAALMNASAEVDLDVPTPLAFDHVITVATIGGRDIWLDPTVGVIPFRYLMPQLLNQNALVATATAASTIRKTPKEPALSILHKLDVSGAVNKDGNLDAIVKFSTRGDLEVLLRLFNSLLPPAQFSSFVQEVLTKGNRLTYGGSTFSDFRLENAGDISNPLRGQFRFVGKLTYVNFQAKSPDSLIDGANLALAKNFGTGWASKGPLDASAPAGEPGSPKEYSLTLQVTVPTVKLAGTEKPVVKRMTSSAGDYESGSEWRGQTLRADWRVILPAARPATAEDYAQFGKDVLQALTAAYTRTEVTKTAPTPTTSSAASAAAYSPAPEVEALYKQGQTEGKLENYANAAKLFQSATKIDPKYSNAWRELGRSYMYLRDYSDAEAAFREYLALSPDDHLAYLNMAWVLYDEKKYSEEVDLLQKRIAKVPGDGDAHTRLGAAYLALHQPDRAMTELERGVEIFPKYQFAQFTLARAYLETHQDAKAAASFQGAIDINPTDSILNSAAYTLAEHSSSLNTAGKWAEQAISKVEIEANQATLRTPPARLSILAQKLAMYWDTLGWVKFQQGEYPAAEKYIFAAWQMQDSSTIGRHLARVYAAQGRRAEAVEIYSTIVNSLPAEHEMSKDEQDASKELAVLQGGDPSEESLVAAARDRLRSLRVLRIDNTARAQGIAQYLMLIGPRAKVLDMEAVGPDSGLGKLGDSLRSTPMPQSFPDVTIQNIPRLGTLACLSPDQTCTLTLGSTASASRVLPLISE